MKILNLSDKIAILLIVAITIVAIFALVNQPINTKDVYQYVDHDSQVVCYILKNGNGISCLPLSEVNLNE